MGGTGDQTYCGISGAGDDSPRRLKWESGLWAETARAGGLLWEGTLTWGSSLHYLLCSRPGSSITSVTAWYFPAYLPSWTSMASHTTLNPLQLALYLMRASSFSL